MSQMLTLNLLSRSGFMFSIFWSCTKHKMVRFVLDYDLLCCELSTSGSTQQVCNGRNARTLVHAHRLFSGPVSTHNETFTDN